jgi:hypothetical protein
MKTHGFIEPVPLDLTRRADTTATPPSQGEADVAQLRHTEALTLPWLSH